MRRPLDIQKMCSVTQEFTQEKNLTVVLIVQSLSESTTLMKHLRTHTGENHLSVLFVAGLSLLHAI